MGHYSSAEEVQQEHLSTLGPNLGPVYHALYNECAWLHIKWQQYVELFGTKPERIDLLNRTASLFFRIVQDTLLDDALLHIAKFTDHPGSGKKKQRLTLQRLPELISDYTLRSEIEKLIDSAIKVTEFARDWRNRRIAHRNLALAIKEKTISLTPASRKQIKDALEAISRPLQRINEFYFNSQIIFGLMPEPKGAIDLLYVIHEGVQAREKRRQRLRKGIIQKEDLEPPTEV